MNNYTKAAEAIQDYLNEIYRLTRGDDKRTISMLAELLENELRSDDVKLLVEEITKEKEII